MREVRSVKLAKNNKKKKTPNKFNVWQTTDIVHRIITSVSHRRDTHSWRSINFINLNFKMAVPLNHVLPPRQKKQP